MPETEGLCNNRIRSRHRLQTGQATSKHANGAHNGH